MKSKFWMLLLVLVAWSVTGCAGNSLAAPEATQAPATVEDQASLVAVLQSAGATVEVGETLSQPFLSPQGNILKVKGADVQVFEYPSPEAMEAEAAQLSADGSSTVTSVINWIDTPHFYKAGRLIVLYVGGDEEVLGLLEQALGPQFAGK